MESGNKSYRIRTTPNAGENVKLNITLKQDYDFIDILSLKLDQRNIYQTPRTKYGCLIGRVMANGGVGVPNARISVFIPASAATKNDGTKRVLYPYDSPTDKNYKTIRYNLLQDKNINECHQVIGTMPLKRAVLDNNDLLEVFDEYYKYTTVTNSHGDYMLFGIPAGNAQIHCDVDISDCGNLSQMPRDMYYRGYSVDQFESSTQFKKDVNLNNLAQVFSEDTSVYVYPFWGDSAEDEVGITRYDINIAYKFEPTCVFIGSVITDSDNATIYSSCLPQEALGRMSDLTTKQGTIEMIRMEPDGKISNIKIKGNQLIDTDGVWCYQIPMNLDYYTTDEFGNDVLSDNPSIGIPTRTDVRFKIKLEQGADQHKMKACYLVPHNPENYNTNEVNYTLNGDTPKNLFVSMFKNNVYSIKSYIPRIQTTESVKMSSHTGIKNVETPSNNLPFPYNSIQSRISLLFTILCVIATIVITFMRMLNQLVTTLVCLGCDIGFCVDFRLFSFCVCMDPCRVIREIFCLILKKIKCFYVDPSWCPYANIIVFPGCDENCAKQTTCSRITVIGSEKGHPVDPCKSLQDNNQDSVDMESDGDTVPLTASTNEDIDETATIQDCVISTLAEDSGAARFIFANDWVNGVLYFPTFNYVKRKRKRRQFLGILGKYIVKVYEDVCSLDNENTIINNEGDKQTISSVYEKGVKKLKVYKSCSPMFNEGETDHLELKYATRNGYRIECGDNTFELSDRLDVSGLGGKVKDGKRKINNNKCHQVYSYIETQEPYINRMIIDLDKDGNPIYEYYYRPVVSDGTTELDGKKGYGGRLINYFKTDIILLGSLDTCNKHGIWGLYEELPITTYQIPGPMYEIEYNVNDNGEFVWADSVFISSGRNWGYRGGNQFDADIIKSEYPFRRTSNNNTGGLFYGIGCNKFETKIKTCANLERICELGVNLDVFMTRDDVCGIDNIGRLDDAKMEMTPQGFIGKDQLIQGIETRQKFATLNQRKLNTFKIVNGELQQNLITHDGKKYYDFDYIFPTNFDSKMSGIFNENQTSIDTRYYNTINESYIDPEYFKFRYGYLKNGEAVTRLNPQIALVNEKILDKRRPANKITGLGFFQPVNSFYFYFGIKSGSTAIEKLRQKFAAKCYQNNDGDVQIQTTVVKHPLICWCGNTKPSIPEVRVEIIGATTKYSIEIKSSKGVNISFSAMKGKEFICSDTIKCKSIDPTVEQLTLISDSFDMEETFFIIYTDEYGVTTQSQFTLQYQNKVTFRLEQQSPIYGSLPSDATPFNNDNYPLFQQGEGGNKGRAKILLTDIGNIRNKNCFLKNYELKISRRETDIGRGAQFYITGQTNGTVNKNQVKIESDGFGYVIGAYGQLGDQGAYIRVNSVGVNGNITSFSLAQSNGVAVPQQTSIGYGYSSSDVNNKKIFTVEKMSTQSQDRIFAIEPHESHYQEYDSDVTVNNEPNTEELRRLWKGFAIYLPDGDFHICLSNKSGNCTNKDVSCQNIKVEIVPPVDLIFYDKIYAKYFLTREIDGYSGNKSPNDDEWWTGFFRFLREPIIDNKILVEKFREWYNGPNISITEENIISDYIDPIKTMWMPTCTYSLIYLRLLGGGYVPPFRTLLYGRKKINNMLVASDTYNSLHPNDTNELKYNDIPYQTHESTHQGILKTYNVFDENGNQIGKTYTESNTAAGNHFLSPEALTFTSSRNPIENKGANYRIGGFYAGVIGRDGAGRAAGYNSTLTSVIQELQHEAKIRLGEQLEWEDDYQVNALEIKEKLTMYTGGWETNANSYLFKFHILDQTLKVFKEWNRLSAVHENYYAPDECNKRNIPAYVDIWFLNGPVGTELTFDVPNSTFDVVGMGNNENMVRGIYPEMDAAMDAAEASGDDIPDGVVGVSAPNGVIDYKSHLGTCPANVPVARHFYSLSSFEDAGSISIEQRDVTILNQGTPEEEEQITVICSDTAATGLDLTVTNNKNMIAVSSYITCTANENNPSVTNHYMHGIEMPEISEDTIEGAIGGNLSPYELYEIPYKGKNACGGNGGSIFWQITETGISGWASIFSWRKKKPSPQLINYQVFSRGNGYKIGDEYTLMNTLVSDDLRITVTGSVVGFKMDANTGKIPKSEMESYQYFKIDINGGRESGYTSIILDGDDLIARMDNNTINKNPLTKGIVTKDALELNEILDDDGEITHYQIIGIKPYFIDENNINNSRAFLTPGCGYKTPPKVTVRGTIDRTPDISSPWSGVLATATGVLGSNYYDTLFWFPPTTSREDYFEYLRAKNNMERYYYTGVRNINHYDEPATRVGNTKLWIKTHYPNGQTTTETYTDEFGNTHSTEITIPSNNGELYSFVANNRDPKRWDGNGILLRESVSSSGFWKWIRKTTKTTVDWMSDLMCNTPGQTTGTPEDLLYYRTTDTWQNRFKYPVYTKSTNRFVYAGIDPQDNEPHTECSAAEGGPGSSLDCGEDICFTSETTRTLGTTVESVSTNKRVSILDLLLPFHGNVPVKSGENWDGSIFFSVLHNNNTAVRAFAQPLDFGNYIFLTKDSIKYNIPNPLFPLDYNVSISFEIRGRNAFKCYGYTIKIEEGRFNTNTTTFLTKADLELVIPVQHLNGYDLFDTGVPDCTPIIDPGCNLDVKEKPARWIRLEEKYNSYTYPAQPNVTKFTLDNLHFSSRDLDRLIRISATDVTGLEIYTYISLFKHIDIDERVTYCVYNCNNELEQTLNTGFVINFEWKNHITDADAIGKKIAYLTQTKQPPTKLDNGIMMGKNLIQTDSYDTTHKGTILSDGTTLKSDYHGSVYIWFDPQGYDEDKNEWLFDENKKDYFMEIEINSSSCYMMNHVIWDKE